PPIPYRILLDVAAPLVPRDSNAGLIRDRGERFRDLLGSPALSDGFKHPRFSRVGHDKGVIVPARSVILGWHARAKLPILLDQAPHEFNRTPGGRAALQRKPHKIHAQQPQSVGAPVPLGQRRLPERLGKDRLVTDHDTMLVDALLIAPAPVWARAERSVG